MQELVPVVVTGRVLSSQCCVEEIDTTMLSRPWTFKATWSSNTAPKILVHLSGMSWADLSYILIRCCIEWLGWDGEELSPLERLSWRWCSFITNRNAVFVERPRFKATLIWIVQFVLRKGFRDFVLKYFFFFFFGIEKSKTGLYFSLRKCSWEHTHCKQAMDDVLNADQIVWRYPGPTHKR